MPPRGAAEARSRRRLGFASLPGSWRGTYEIALFAFAYLAYFGVRAVTEGDMPRALVNARHLVDFEQVLSIDWERGLQTVTVDSTVIRDAANGVYIWGHWPVLIVGGILLFNLSRPHYFRFRNVCLLSGAIGLIVFALFPVAPPRLAGLGFVDTITVHAAGYRKVLPPSLINEYAAMPSFHAGWNLMLGIAVFSATTNLFLRTFAILMPAAMGFATVATANHFVVDVIAGGAIVVLSYLVVRRLRPLPTLVAHDSIAPDRDGPAGTPSVRGRPSRRQRPRGTPPSGASRRAAD